MHHFIAVAAIAGLCGLWAYVQKRSGRGCKAGACAKRMDGKNGGCTGGCSKG